MGTDTLNGLEAGGEALVTAASDTANAVAAAQTGTDNFIEHHWRGIATVAVIVAGSVLTATCVASVICGAGFALIGGVLLIGAGTGAATYVLQKGSTHGAHVKVLRPAQ